MAALRIGHTAKLVKLIGALLASALKVLLRLPALNALPSLTARVTLSALEKLIDLFLGAIARPRLVRLTLLVAPFFVVLVFIFVAISVAALSAATANHDALRVRVRINHYKDGRNEHRSQPEVRSHGNSPEKRKSGSRRLEIAAQTPLRCSYTT
jgi:hypothetical protein